ncbi:acetyl-CoA synthetase-like protein [Exidia glandulosa HHB12029]|uniref:Acetyl-CoA synthetase-like protein n=1 Tax=Exidia glandulosa HHB12029 TaxID=1314781 RepID=A0A165GEZ8_EXIGL|nr:acetyl-CoA synthetase-like protein [Exidia glandulosa HHB12029]
MSAEFLLRTDSLTYTLGILAATVYIARKWLEPMPLVPPLILGRQSDASKTRQPGETAVYRNYGTGFMSARLPVRPSREIQTANDIVKTDFKGSRTLWGTKITNAELKERVAAFASGLLRGPVLTPRASRVLLLLNDSLEWLITDLALAAIAVPSVTLATLDLLSDVLDKHPPSAIVVHGDFFMHVLELLAESASASNYVVIVLGDLRTDARRHAQQLGVTVFHWNDISARGTEEKAELPAVQPSDLFTIAFSRGVTDNDLLAVQFTHENLTAGVVATHFLLPYQNALSDKDSMISAFPLATPFGRAVAYTALFQGASFTTLPSARLIVSASETYAPDLSEILSTVESQRAPSPTVLVVTRLHLNSLTKAVLGAVSGALKPFAWRQKNAALAAGALSRDTVWDKLVFAPARRAALGPMGTTMRAVVLSGGPLDAVTLPAARIALSTPIVNTFQLPSVMGPVFGSHPADVQTFPPVAGDIVSELAHVGPPATNVEVKIVGIKDADHDTNVPIVGDMLFRGPTIGTPGLGERRAAEDEWIRSGEVAAVQPNGSFKILPRGM